MLVLSGGVSAGVLDLVPASAAATGRRAGVPQGAAQAGQAHVVRRLPCGTTTRAWCSVCLAIPVGSLVCFRLVCDPRSCERSAGHAAVIADPQPAQLAVAHHHRSDRPTYHPALAQWSADGGRLLADPRRPGEVRPISEPSPRANCLMLCSHPGQQRFCTGRVGGDRSCCREQWGWYALQPRSRHAAGCPANDSESA